MPAIGFGGCVDILKAMRERIPPIREDILPIRGGKSNR